MSELRKLTWLWCGADEGRWLKAPGEFETLTLRNYTFCWCRQGTSIVTIGDASFELGPECMILSQPGQSVKTQYDPLEPTVIYGFMFDMPTTPAWWPPKEEWPAYRRMQADDILRPLFEYILGHAIIPSGPGAYNNTEIPPAVQSAVETLMTAYIMSPTNRGISSFVRYFPAPIQRVLAWMLDFMNADPSKKVTLEDLAAVAGVSAKHLCRLFQKHLGYPPLEVLYLYRVTRSLIGLRSGRKIDALAQDLGFADAAHYTRRFHAWFGKSPARMRKAMAKGYRPKLPELPNM